MFNKNELILDKVRNLTAHDLATGQLLFRLTSLEEPSLQCTAESEEVTDAMGSVITTLYRAKKATLSATNSLISLDLAAEQYGTKKQIAGLKDYTYGNDVDENAKIEDYTYEILTPTEGKITLAHKASKEIKYIYSIENNEIGTMYVAGAAASATNFVVDNEIGDTTVITVPEGLTGKIYVEYQYETLEAIRISNRASEFPRAVSLVVYAYFKDRCNENLVYSGKIICPKAKLNPEQVELALTSTGKHAFEFTMMKDYCAEEGDDELFAIIVAQ